ncbi:hypothetical protein MTO96_050456 [Rhipicephalus appendiculatus]
MNFRFTIDGARYARKNTDRHATCPLRDRFLFLVGSQSLEVEVLTRCYLPCHCSGVLSRAVWIIIVRITSARATVPSTCSDFEMFDLAGHSPGFNVANNTTVPTLGPRHTLESPIGRVIILWPWL